MPVGPLEDNGPNTINMTLRNMKGSIVNSVFEFWEHFIPEVRMWDNQMNPHDEALYSNYQCWDTRIYHFIMNQNLLNIESCAMTIQSIPSTFPQGDLLTINNDSNSRRSANQDTISIAFRSIGSRANTYEVVNSFNLCTEYFNKNMADSERSKYYRKLHPSEYLEHGNNVAYPWINIDTMEFEFYIPVKK